MIISNGVAFCTERVECFSTNIDNDLLISGAKVFSSLTSFRVKVSGAVYVYETLLLQIFAVQPLL